LELGKSIKMVRRGVVRQAQWSLFFPLLPKKLAMATPMGIAYQKIGRGRLSFRSDGAMSMDRGSCEIQPQHRPLGSSPERRGCKESGETWHGACPSVLPEIV
jgi:hypothetical protein